MHVMGKSDWRFYLKSQIEGAKIGHITEALAHAAGFKTHAAELASGEDVPFARYDREAFIGKMRFFGYTVPDGLQFL